MRKNTKAKKLHCGSLEKSKRLQKTYSVFLKKPAIYISSLEIKKTTKSAAPHTDVDDLRKDLREKNSIFKITSATKIYPVVKNQYGRAIKGWALVLSGATIL